MVPQATPPQPEAIDDPVDTMDDLAMGGMGGMAAGVGGAVGMGGMPGETPAAGGAGGESMGAAGAGGSPEEPAGVTFGDVHPILLAACGGMACHGDGATNNHPELASMDPATAEAVSTELAMELLDRITRMPNAMGFMPRMADPLSEEDIATIEAWVQSL